MNANENDPAGGSTPIPQPPSPAVNSLTIEQLRAEVWAWRCEAAARIQMMTASIAGSVARGEVDRAIDIKVNFLMPSVNALTGLLAGDVDVETCEACGQPLLDGQRVWPCDGSSDVHVACWPDPEAGSKSDAGGPDPESYVYASYYSDERILAVLAAGKAVVLAEDDASEGDAA